MEKFRKLLVIAVISGFVFLGCDSGTNVDYATLTTYVTSDVTAFINGVSVAHLEEVDVVVGSDVLFSTLTTAGDENEKTVTIVGTETMAVFSSVEIEVQ